MGPLHPDKHDASSSAHAPKPTSTDARVQYRAQYPGSFSKSSLEPLVLKKPLTSREVTDLSGEKATEEISHIFEKTLQITTSAQAPSSRPEVLSAAPSDWELIYDTYHNHPRFVNAFNYARYLMSQEDATDEIITLLEEINRFSTPFSAEQYPIVEGIIWAIVARMPPQLSKQHRDQLLKQLHNGLDTFLVLAQDYLSKKPPVVIVDEAGNKFKSGGWRDITASDSSEKIASALAPIALTKPVINSIDAPVETSSSPPQPLHLSIYDGFVEDVDSDIWHFNEEYENALKSVFPSSRPLPEETFNWETIYDTYHNNPLFIESYNKAHRLIGKEDASDEIISFLVTIYAFNPPLNDAQNAILNGAIFAIIERMPPQLSKEAINRLAKILQDRDILLTLAQDYLSKEPVIAEDSWKGKFTSGAWRTITAADTSQAAALALEPIPLPDKMDMEAVEERKKAFFAKASALSADDQALLRTTYAHLKHVDLSTFEADMKVLIPVFNRIIGSEPYLVFYVKAKSNKWVTQLSLKWGAKLPADIVDEDSLDLPRPSYKTIVFFDDGSYSGLQLAEHLLAAAKMQPSVKKIVVMVPYVSKEAEARILAVKNTIKKDKGRDVEICLLSQKPAMPSLSDPALFTSTEKARITALLDNSGGPNLLYTDWRRPDRMSCPQHVFTGRLSILAEGAVIDESDTDAEDIVPEVMPPYKKEPYASNRLALYIDPPSPEAIH